MKNYFFKVTISLIFGFFITHSFSTTLEDQFEGLLHCDQMGKLKGIYFDQYTESPNFSKTPYIAERNLIPCELDSLAVYCINDHYYGLDVEKIAIPNHISTYALYFKQDMATVKKQLSKYINVIDYDIEDKALNYPSIIPNQDEEGKAILFCDFSSERD